MSEEARKMRDQMYSDNQELFDSIFESIVDFSLSDMRDNPVEDGHA